MKDSSLFLSSFIKDPTQVGAIAPSSRFLTREIIKNIDFSSSKNIVELGPGLGTFTKAILRKANTDARLVCFEVNASFRGYLAKNLADKRMHVTSESAEKLSSTLKKLKIKANCIVSGLPFKNFPLQKRKKILGEIRDSLGKNARFILLQYTNDLRPLLDSYFKKVSRSFVPLNMPPAFVFVCEN